MELRYFVIILCLFSVGNCLEDRSRVAKVSFDIGRKEDKLSKNAPYSPRMKKSSEYLRIEDEEEENVSNESIDRSPTNHLPYSHGHGHGHGHSPYVQMVFKLAADAIEASDASQRISHQLSMNHGYGYGHSGAMVKMRVPLYKQSYPVLFQHGHIMHDEMGGLPYPYTPTMRGRDPIVHRRRGADLDMENYSGEASNLLSHGLALAHRHRNGHQAPNY